MKNYTCELIKYLLIFDIFFKKKKNFLIILNKYFYSTSNQYIISKSCLIISQSNYQL